MSCDMPGNGEGRDYQCTIREFPGGRIEASTQCIQAMKRMQLARSWLSFNPVKVRSEVVELSESELEKKAAESRAVSVRRARQKVRWLVKSLGADHMVTFSYRENMEDVERLKVDWAKFVRLFKAKYPDWKFVAVREYQDRGALHLHVATKGKQDIKYLRKCWYIALGASPDATGEDTPGQIDVTGPKRHWGSGGYIWRPDKLSGYLTKYLHKAFDIEAKGAKRYWHSKSIDKPLVSRVWLGAATFPQAVAETHDLIRAGGAKSLTMWASEGYESIWMTG